MKKTLSIFILLALICGFLYQTGYSQVNKRVLFENWTSSTCGPCASNNPALRQWISDHWAGLVCVSYHVGWPSPGNDPMYLANPTESYDRRYYYNVNAVPTAWLMGERSYVGSPYNWANMSAWYDMYSAQSTPLGITVTDTRIPPDSNRVNITVVNYSALPSGTYYMRVMVVEHLIAYSSPPGTNGETQFQNVFRKSLPSSTGTVIPTAAGTYNFEFRYKIQPTWQDTSVYTLAFVQNDVDKTIMNAGRHGMLTGITPGSTEIPSEYALMQNYPNPFNPMTNIRFNIPEAGNASLKIYDLLGNLVGVYFDGYINAGSYTIPVDGANLASGVYFYRLTAKNFVDTKKMSLTK